MAPELHYKSKNKTVSVVTPRRDQLPVQHNRVSEGPLQDWEQLKRRKNWIMEASALIMFLHSFLEVFPLKSHSLVRHSLNGVQSSGHSLHLCQQ